MGFLVDFFGVFFSKSHCWNHPEAYLDLKSLYTVLSHCVKLLLVAGNYLSDISHIPNIKSSIGEKVLW